MNRDVFDLESAIEFEIYENSNCEYFPTKEDIDISIKKHYFPKLEYFYSQLSFNEFEKYNINIDDILVKKNSNEYYISLNNKIDIKYSINQKKAKDYPKLTEKILKKGFKLESIVDIEFFENYYLHNIYLENMNGKLDEKLLKYKEETKDFKSKSVYGLPTPYQLRKYFLYEDINFFEMTFYAENPNDLIDFIDENNAEKISKNKFTSFMDTEKIHIQYALISKENQKNIPVLVYYGHGNYYPFSPRIKNNSNRFQRFSMLNSNDEINLNYIENEFKKTPEQRKIDLIEKINFSQQNYYKYFNENFSLKERKKEFEKKYTWKIFSTNQEELLMLLPILRTKSSALLAKKYFEEKFNF